jgi:hypothetical protein
MKHPYTLLRTSVTDARQNSNYYVGYSIGALQGRKQRKLSQNTETISEVQ